MQLHGAVGGDRLCQPRGTAIVNVIILMVFPEIAPIPTGERQTRNPLSRKTTSGEPPNHCPEKSLDMITVRAVYMDCLEFRNWMKKE